MNELEGITIDLSKSDGEPIRAIESEEVVPLILTASAGATGEIEVEGSDSFGNTISEPIMWGDVRVPRAQMTKKVVHFEKGYARNESITLRSMGSGSGTVTVRLPHRRARIINAIANLFAKLTKGHDPLSKGFPIEVKTIQRRFVHWTALDQQDALPAILLTYGDDGSAPDSDVVGFIDEQFPIAVTAVMKEDRFCRFEMDLSMGEPHTIPADPDSPEVAPLVLTASPNTTGQIRVMGKNAGGIDIEETWPDVNNPQTKTKNAYARNEPITLTPMGGGTGIITYRSPVNDGMELTDLAADIHYSIGRLINEDRTLGIEGVNPERTRIVSWGGSEGAISKFEIIRFRVLVVHRYLATEDV